MASSAVSSLAGKVIGELFSLPDLGQLWWGSGTKYELEKMRNTLSAIEAVLLDAEEKQATSQELRDWLLKIRIVSYDIEDLLMEFSTEALKRQVMAKNKNLYKEVLTSFPLSIRLNKMARGVKLFSKRLDALASERYRFRLIDPEESTTLTSSRNHRREETHSFIVPGKLIGRYEDEKSVKKLLLQSDAQNNVSVISIVGIGGVGKTALAQLVYNSIEVKQHFDLMMWVFVSEIFDIKRTCEMILESVTHMRSERRLPMELLMDAVKRAIDGRKYLLVLDDVWNEDHTKWMDLLVMLMSGAQGSKILITARAELVARAANSVAIHFLKGLSPHESWMMFKQVAFQRGEEPENSRIVGIGKEVVDICAGNPLAIRAVGSMLRFKDNEIDWLNFRRDGLQWITQGSGSQFVKILRLSYDYLSPPLKRCLAYCAVFPKDYKIYKTTLIWLWIAQGIVQPDGTTRSLEEVGEKLFQDLLVKSFFQDCGADETGEICYYKLQNLMYDLVQSIQGNECCVDGSEVNFLTRHARVTTGDIPPNLFDATKLRTLLVKNQVDLGTFTDDRTLRSFKYMRVLELAMLKIESVPRFIGRLSLLHYLDLSRNTFHFLPESVGKLYNLQTLILTKCKNLKKLPNGTKNLVRLRHLDTTDCDDLRCMPRGLGELTCLQTLSDFVMWAENTKCAELIELKSLVNLTGTVTIRNLRGYRAAGKDESGQRYDYPDLLTQHKFILYLWLEWSLKDDIEPEEELLLFQSLQPHPNLEKLYFRDYRGLEFPRWMDIVNIGICLPNIVYIGITNCSSCKHLPPFGLLPSLEHLFLWDVSCLEYIYNEEDQWNSSASTSSSRGKQLFPSLKKLDLFNMPQLKGLGKWRRTRDVVVLQEASQHFPVLEELYICSCPLFTAGSSEEGKQLQSLSSLHSVYIYNSLHEGHLVAGLQFVPNLKSLTLERCENLVALPDWMGNLTSLQEIHLKFCESLGSIPACFQRLTSLRRLVTRSCPKLRKRCKDEIGDDWPNIAHIPYVRIR